MKNVRLKFYTIPKNWIINLLIDIHTFFSKITTKIAINKFRHECAFWGLDLSNLSDEQLIHNSIKLSQIIVKSGVTAGEFVDKLSEISEIRS